MQIATAALKPLARGLVQKLRPTGAGAAEQPRAGRALQSISLHVERPFSYAVSAAAVAATLLLKELVDRVTDVASEPFILFALPVLVSSLYGGLGPGLFATILSAVVVDYFLLDPPLDWATSPSDLLRLGLFVMEGLAISAMSSVLRIRRLAERTLREAQIQDRSMRETEERYRLLVEGVKDYAIYWLDPDGRVASWNAGAERTYGYRAAEVVGSRFGIFHTAEDRRAGLPERELEVARREGRVETRGWRMRKDGSRFWVDTVMTLLVDESGAPRGFAKITRDVTQPMRAEEERARLLAREQSARALAEAGERHYRALAEAIPQIVWTTDAAGAVEYLNQRWVEYTGLSLEQSLGWAWLKALHPEDRPECEAAWRAALASGEFLEIEARFRRGQDGSQRWQLIRGVPVRDRDGTVLRWLGTCTDIDDQKLAELTSELLSEASSALASSMNYESTLQVVADLMVPQVAEWCFIHVLGDGRAQESVTIAHDDAVKLEAARDLARRYPIGTEALFGRSKVIRSGEPEVVEEMPRHAWKKVARDSDDLKLLQSLAIHSYASVPLHVRGRILGALTVACTETGRRFAAADLGFAEELARRIALAVDNSRHYREAQQANRMKDEFLSTVSHELRTPLTAILGWAQLLRIDTMDAETAKRGLELIERGAKQQTQLVEDLLDISRIILGKLRLELRSLELAPIIRAATDAVRPAAEAKEIQLTLALDHRTGEVSGDPDRLQQVVWNLLSNAIKFTPEGGAVEVALSNADSHARIAVRDNGRGIAQEFLPYVFDRFRQAEATSTRSQGGLGLGLAIVRHLVELHGGTVAAESPGEDRGATFTVELPLVARRRSAARAPERAPLQEEGSATGLVRLDGVRMLVVDDQPDARELITAVLEECGAHVTAVGSAAEALDALDQAIPDVMLSDIGMPGEDGYSLIRKIRARGADRGGRVPAAALTAYARHEDHARALNAGFQVHVTKPVEPSKLTAVVADLAGRRVLRTPIRPARSPARSSTRAPSPFDS